MAVSPFTTRPSTRIISWQAEVLAADPQWNQLRTRPVIFEFSNGRTFTQNPTLYTSTN